MAVLFPRGRGRSGNVAITFKRRSVVTNQQSNKLTESITRPKQGNNLMTKLLPTLALCAIATIASAQTPSGASSITAEKVPHTTVPYRIDDQGEKLPDIKWGLDVAWLWDQNVLRGIAFAGEDLIDIIRLSFQTINTEALNGKLTKQQKDTLDMRIALAKKAPNATINLNSDHKEGQIEMVTNYYRSSSSVTQANRWSELIYLTKKYVEGKGLKVTSVSPFNEPDLTGWHQGTKADFLAICRKLRTDETYKDEFADVALCGGNTCNNDRALEWYNYCKAYLDEGNTHQLAGSFDTFVEFYKKVAADGKVGVADELHNTMEAMVASNYGLGKAIWWGTCDYTRSQFMRASRGTRLGYAENSTNWTAASVYRHPSGYVQGFGGTSERQAYGTTFRMAATDHDVFYNGHGPTREYSMTLPGGTGYQNGQTNAEGLVNIQGGDDVMPPLPLEATTYRIANRASRLYLAPENNIPNTGTNVCQMLGASGNTGQQWVVAPVELTVGGDFSYYRITSAKNRNTRLGVDRWTIDDKANVYMSGETTINIQWTIEYAGDGWFYLRNRQSGHYLQVNPSSSVSALRQSKRNINLGKFTGETYQQWRFLPVGVKYDEKAPAAPTNLSATPQSQSVRLTWTAPADEDVATYTILRSTDQTTWHVINQGITTTMYVDNTTLPETTYYYKVRARDASLNHSEAGNIVSAAPTDADACIMHIACDSLYDSTCNGNHAALYGTPTLTEGKLGQALQLDGKTQFLQLPATIATSRELSVAAWVYWTGGNTWQRIFDFGLDTDHYFFVSPKNGDTSKLRIAIKSGSTERKADASKALATNSWQHVAAVLANDGIRLYLNGQQVAQLNATERPADFMPIFNYVGRSQFRADPMLKGSIDDVRIYNYALSEDELTRLANGESVGIGDIRPTTTNEVDEPAYRIDGIRVSPSQMRPHQLYIRQGRKTIVK